MEPLELMEVLRPLPFRSRAKGSVTPERNGSLTFPKRFLAVVVVGVLGVCSMFAASDVEDVGGGGGGGGGR